MTLAQRILQLLEADHSKTCFSCFLFEGEEDFEKLHVTHKYFAEQPAANIYHICKIMDAYFAAHPFKPVDLVFDKEEWFGKDKEVRVLTPSTSIKAPPKAHPLLLDLREELDQFRKDDYSTYKPHVTTDLEVIDRPLVNYIFVVGAKVLRKY